MAFLEQSLSELLEEQARAYAQFDSLSASRLSAFEEIARWARDVGTELVAFTTPVHPSLRNALRQRPHYEDRQQELRSYMQRMAPEEGFVFVDLADVSTYGGDPADWLDTLHHGEATGRLIIDRLLAARAP